MGLASAIVGQLIIAAAEVIWPSNRESQIPAWLEQLDLTVLDY